MNHQLQLYDQLLQFPLFQGMSHDDLAQVAGHTKFDFQKLAAQRTIVADGNPCTHLNFLLSGNIIAVSSADDHSYTMNEQLAAPYILQPEAIFGYHQRYTHTFLSETPVSLLRLEREEVVRLSNQFLVFRINLLNIFATRAQKLSQQLWNHYPETLDDRIVRFISQHCIHPAGPKTLHILMNQLALELGDSRLDVSRALNRLQDKGLLTLYRGRIEIPLLEKMFM
jgi:CRP-like cAMP-binding protein